MDKDRYTQQEDRLSEQSQAFLQMLTNRGIVEDSSINDERIRQADKEKKRNMYHNTMMLLENYREIVWALESFPVQIAAELNRPMRELDALISVVNAEIGMNNMRLESRLQSVAKSRLLLDRFNEAVSVLRQKPGEGLKLYDIIFQTYITPEKLSHVEILYRLNMSDRHYYRLRKKAISILSIRLWSAPAAELDSWLEVLTLLEGL